MTASKTTSKATAQPGPKPDFAVVESTLKCQTSLDGEISLSLAIPYSNIKKMMKFEDVAEEDSIDYILEEVLSPEDSATLQGLKDGTDTLRITLRYIEELGKRMGASLGESVSSSAS